MRQPYAYLRKSRVFRDQTPVSPEMQLTAAREYAAGFGDTGLIVLTDLNISGRKGRAKRPGFAQLLDALEAGKVSAIYSYSLSRLSRSVRDMLALADLCKAQKVPIRLARDMDPDPTTASGRMMLGMLALLAQFEADLGSERSLDSAAARRQRGDHMGGKFFEDTDAVVAAYREARTVTGAAKLLTRRGVPTRNLGTVWYPSSVSVILRRAAPTLLPRHARAGAKHSAPFTFYRLLRCHCGTTMTGVRSKVKNGIYTAYLCNRGRVTHPEKAYITERIIEAWARREMERLQPPTEPVMIADIEAERHGIAQQMELVKTAFLAGLMDEPEMRARKAEIDDLLMRLDLAGQAVQVPQFSWDHQPRDLNLALRALWDHVQLGPDLRPLRAEWLLPAGWLRDPAAPRSPAAQEP